MQDWQDKFNELRKQFLHHSGERIALLESLVQDLPSNPAPNAGVLRELRKQFHWLAGSGGVYGFDTVSGCALQGEEICENLLYKNRTIAQNEIDSLQHVVKLVKGIFGDTEYEEDQITAQVFKDTAKHKQVVNLLVIDNQQVLMFDLSQVSEEKDLVINHVHTASEARNELEKKLPDAIVLSLPLLDSDGCGLIKLLRSMPGGDKPPAIIISRSADFLDKVEAIRSGADAFFEYPLDEIELGIKLQHLLERNKPEKYKILCVDDDQDQLAFLKLTLETAGYSVLALSDSQKFEETFLRFKPDLVLLDVMLDSITGFELAQYIRQKDRFAALPVLFLSTESALDMLIKSAKIGGDEYLVKPIAPQLLAASVAGHLEKSRILKSLIQRDGLTGCLNHGSFMEQATVLIKPDPHRFSLTLLLIDIDSMNTINDRYGFAVGDKVIRSTGPLLRKFFRNANIIGRIAGDQFAVILENLDDDQIQRLANKLILEFATTKQYAEDQEFQSTLSIGFVQHNNKMDLQSWIQYAQKSLTQAKNQGGNKAISKTNELHWSAWSH